MPSLYKAADGHREPDGGEPYATSCSARRTRAGFRDLAGRPGIVAESPVTANMRSE